LRRASFWIALVLLGGVSAEARTAPVRVLVGTSVAKAARDTISTSLWARLIRDYVAAEVVPFDGTPTLDDCHHAKAAYMVDAPFRLRLRLPGLVNSDGRMAAITHLVVTNCVTGQVAFDRVIPMDSDLPNAASAGDFEPVPEISWSQAVPRELGRYPLFFPRVARIRSVETPFAYLDLGGTKPLNVGDTLRAFASANGERRDPVLLTVTNTDLKYVQVLFSATAGDAIPQAGDYVEPVLSPVAAPSGST
jgi:hypothetical protein